MLRWTLGLIVISLATCNALAIEESIEEILVTGSHIKRSNFDGPAPVVVFDEEDLRISGVNTLGEFARFLPSNLSELNDARSINRGTRGTAQFNLRGIGIDSTLTLVNGRRIASYGAALNGDQQFVDINSIPLASIERIEILKDGASAIYGADAMAGVVNIILNQKLEGWHFEAGYLTTSRSDHDEMALSVAFGTAFGSTHLTGTLSYFDRTDLSALDREYSRDADLTSNAGFDQRSRFSAPPTVFLPGSFRLQPDPECPDGPISFRVGTPAFGACAFNYRYASEIILASERIGFTGSLRHDTDSVTYFAEAFVSSNDGRSTLTPSPLSTAIPGSITGSPIVPIDHPNNPFGEQVEIFYRTTDAGNRVFDVDALTYRLLFGAEGEWGRFDWRMDASLSESQVDNRMQNAILQDEFQAALFGLGGTDGQSYYNPFGLNPQNDPSLIARMRTTTKRQETASEDTVTLNLNTDVFELPAGPVAMALGLQYRSQSLEERFSENLRSGRIAGSITSNPIDESRTVGAAFLEFGLPLAESLELQLAVRYEHYDDFGSSTNPKLALRWDALPWLAFRASYTTSFRPPSFRELQDDGLASVRFFVDNKRCPLTDAQEDCFIFPYRSSTTGNPQLDPEEGDSRYFGLILTPIENLRLGIDYWVFKHEDRIVSIDGQLLINDFPVNTPFVERNPPTTSEAAQGIPGRIQIVNSTYVNADQVDTNGIDVNVEYRIEFGAGSIDLTFLYTYLNEWRITEKLAQEFTEDRAGSRELPRHRGNLGVTWNRGRHRLGGIVRYVDSYDSPVNVVVNQRETAEKFQVDDWLILDLNYQIAFERLASAALQIGCHNCTDEDVPVYNYSVAGSNLHDGRGATVYIRWTQSI